MECETVFWSTYTSCADEQTLDGKSVIIIYYCSFIFKLQHLNAIISNAHQDKTSAGRDGKTYIHVSSFKTVLYNSYMYLQRSNYPYYDNTGKLIQTVCVLQKFFLIFFLLLL